MAGTASRGYGGLLVAFLNIPQPHAAPRSFIAGRFIAGRFSAQAPAKAMQMPENPAI